MDISIVYWSGTGNTKSMADLEGLVSGKRILLFGSYSWGDGEWMRGREGAGSDGIKLST